MFSRRAARLCLIPILCAAAAACDPGVADPPVALTLKVAGPLAPDSPFADPEVRFIAMIAEGPGIVDGAHQIVQKYLPGMALDLGALLTQKDQPIPYGDARQFRIELYPADVNGLPTSPIRASGRSVPVAIAQNDQPRVHTIYVSKVNQFAAAVSDAKVPAQVDHRVGASLVATPDNNALIIGGSKPKTAATDPFDPLSYGSFQTGILLYDTEQRTLFGPIAALSTGRSFMASALGVNGLVAMIGGYVDNGGNAKATDLVEFIDPTTRSVRQATPPVSPPNPNFKAHLSFARAQHSITRLFDNDNYFLVAGGQGAAEASGTWEIWHPVHGKLADGPLTRPRWNHCAARVPDATGGFIMLVGGENADGPINNFEVIRYDDKGHVAYKGNKTITCSVGATTAQDAGCEALKSQPNYAQVAWEPIEHDLDGKGARTLPACGYQTHLIDSVNPQTQKPDKAPVYYVYIVGGFSDAAKTKPMDTISVFDLIKGSWLDHTQSLSVPRGAALLAASTIGPAGPRILVSGGVGLDKHTVDTAEVIYLPSSGVLAHKQVENPTPGGGRVHGAAVALPTGHVLVTGGATSTTTGLKHHGGLSLWSPL